MKSPAIILITMLSCFSTMVFTQCIDQSMVDYIKTSGSSPEDYVLKKFEKKMKE